MLHIHLASLYQDQVNGYDIKTYNHVLKGSKELLAILSTNGMWQKTSP